MQLPTCDHAGCTTVDGLVETGGRDAQGVLWVWWTCEDHVGWADEQVDRLAVSS